MVRYDERGCGLSDWAVEDFSLQAWVGDLEAVVEAAGLERFALLGMSHGGPVVIAYAARHPEQVSHLVLYGTYARGRLTRSAQAREEAELLISLVRVGWGRQIPRSAACSPRCSFPGRQPSRWTGSTSSSGSRPHPRPRSESGVPEASST